MRRILILVICAFPFVVNGAVLKTIQRGTTTFSSGTSVTATITAVTTSKSILLFSCSPLDNSPSYFHVGGELTNSTTLTFYRYAANQNITIKWQVVEFNSGVTVQRGVVNSPTQTGHDVTISAVTLSKSFATVSMAKDGAEYSNDDGVTGDLTTTTNLRLTGTSGVGANVYWQVVEYDNCAVQKKSFTLADASTSTTSTLTSVNTAKTILIGSHDVAVASFADDLPRTELTNATTITVTRVGNTGAQNFVIYAVEFTGTESVVRGTQNFTSGTASNNVNPSLSNYNASAVFCPGSHGWHGSCNQADQYVGHGWFTYDLTSATNLTIARSLSTSTTADAPYEIVTFPTVHPMTWNASSSGNFNTAGNWYGGLAPGSSDTAFFNSTSVQNCAITADPGVRRIQMESGYTGTVTQNAGVAVNLGAGGFNQAAGTFTGGNAKIDLSSNGAFTLSAGTFTATSDTIYLDGNFTISGGTFTHNSGKIKIDGGAPTLNTGSATLNHFRLSTGGDVTVTGTVTVAGNFWLTSANVMVGGTIAVAGNLTTTETSMSTINTTVILINGGGSQTLGTGGAGAGGLIPNIQVNKGGGTLTVQDSIFIRGNWTQTAGTVSMGTSTVVFDANGASFTLTPGSVAFNHVVLNTASNVTISGTLDVNGDFTITNVNVLDGGAITVAGNFANNDNTMSTPRSTAITLDGTGAQTLSEISSADWPTGTLTINKSSGTVTLGSDIVNLTNSGQDLTITAGTLNLSSYALTVVDVLTINGTLTQGAGTVNAGTFTVGSSGVWTNTSTGDIVVGAGGVGNAGAVTLDGTASGCGDADAIVITSSAAPTNRTWSGAGTYLIYDVNATDQTFSGATNVYSTTLSDCPNWTDNACPVLWVTWDGGGANDNWNTANNWDGNVVPVSTDSVKFDGTSTDNCIINVNVTVAKLAVNSGYTGTITQNSSITVTCGVGGYSQAAGTFTGGNSTIDINGNFALSGGTFTATSGSVTLAGNLTVSGGTFNHNSGTYNIDGGAGGINTGSAVFNNITLSAGSSQIYTVTGTLVVNATLQLTNLNLINTGTIAVAGDVITTDYATADPPFGSGVGGTGTILMNGTGNQTLGASGGWGSVPNFSINKTSGTLTVQDSMEIPGSWTWTAGTVSVTGFVSFCRDNGNSSKTINASGMSFGNVIFATWSGDVTTVTGTLDINGNLEFRQIGTINGGNITVAGNLSSIDDYSGIAGTCAITLDGTGTQTVSSIAGGYWPDGGLTINKASGKAVLGSNVFDVPALTITAGTFDQGASYSLRTTGTITVAAAGAWHNVGTGDDTLGGNVTNDGYVRIDGTTTDCNEADAVDIRSTSGGAQRTWSGSGRNRIFDVSATDMGGTVNVYSSTNNSGNGWTFDNCNPTRTWIASSAGNWNTASNWSGSAVPTSSDWVIFDNSSIQNCAIDVNASGLGIQINQGYTGTITQNATRTVTLAGSGYAQYAGTFTGAEAGMSTSGLFTMSGGTFNAGSQTITTTHSLYPGSNWTYTGGTFNGQTSTVLFNAANHTTLSAGGMSFNNATFNTCGTCTIELGNRMDVNGNLTLTLLSGISDTIFVAGNVTTTDATVTSADATSEILFDGSGNQTLSASGGTGMLPAVLINKSGGTLTIQDNIKVGGAGSITGWIYTAGTVDAGSGTITFSAADHYYVSSGAMSFYNVTLNGCAACAANINGTMDINGNLTITTAAGMVGGTITLAGDLSSADASVTNTCAITLNGTGAQSINVGTNDLPDGTFTVNKASGVASLAAALTTGAAGQDLTVTAGTLSLAGFNLTVADVFTVGASGTLRLQGDESTPASATLNSGSTVEYTATSGTRNVKAYSYHHLLVNGSGGTFTLGANRTVAGNLTVTAGTLDANDFTLAINGNTTVNGGTLKTGINTVTFGDAGGDAVTISSGGLEIESDATGTDIVKNASTWTNSGGTITYNGGASTNLLSAISPYNHLTINASGFTYTLNGAIDVNGNLTITAGTLDANNTSNYQINVGGNWSNSGTFTPRAGTVIFDGTSQTLSGASSFYHFTKNVSSAATLTFPASVSQAIAGTWNVQGASGQLLSLRSSSDGTQWQFNPQGTRTIGYLDVKDSWNTNGTSISVNGFNITNSGNNTGWSFQPDTVLRSIGTNSAALYSTGTIATNATKDTLTLSGGTFPSNIGEGDKMALDLNNSAGELETVYILSRVNDTKVALQDPATYAHTGGGDNDYDIKRVYNTLQAWEDASPSNLITVNQVWKGVAYNDGAFTGSLHITGMTTDATHFVWITVAAGQRHNGTPGTGAVMDRANSTNLSLQIGTYNSTAYHTVAEWLEIKNHAGTGDQRGAISFAASYCTGRNLLIYNTTTRQGYGTHNHYNNEARYCKMYNNVFFNMSLGIHNYSPNNDASQNTYYNNTVHRCATGVENFNVYGVWYNNLVAGNTSNWTNMTNAAGGNNAGEAGNTPPGSGDVFVVPYETFVDTALSTFDLHLRSHSFCQDAGSDQSGVFTVDLDGATRSGTWDVGADEWGGNARTYTSGTNTYNIGVLAPVNVTVSSVTGAGPWTVSFSGSPNLSRIFANDCFKDGGANGHKWKISTVNDATDQITVTNSEYSASPSPSSANTHPAAVGRWYNLPSKWEADRDGDLVTRNAIEKGVCYNDGLMTEADNDGNNYAIHIDGSTTDATRYFWLTAAAGEIHNGKPGTGARIEYNVDWSYVININEDYTRVENLEITNSTVTANNAGAIVCGAITGHVVKRMLLKGKNAINSSGYFPDSLINVIVLWGTVGSQWDSGNEVCYNVTIKEGDYTHGGGGTSPKIRNTAVLNGVWSLTGGAWSGSCSNNAGKAGQDPPGSGDITIAATDFVDTTTAVGDMHIVRASALKNRGANLSAVFVNDIDDTIRQYGAWDIGADESTLMDSVQWYVDYETGSDAAGKGRALATPVKNIEYAYDAMPNGATDSVYVINLLPGRHQASYQIQLYSNGPDFTKAAPLIIRSYYPDLDSMAMVGAANGATGEGTFATTEPNIIFDRIIIRGSASGTGQAGIGYYSGSTPNNITVKNCVFLFDSIGGVDSYVMKQGIILYTSDSLLVYNNIFIGKYATNGYDRGDGVASKGNYCKIVNNTFYYVSYPWYMIDNAGAVGTIFANNLMDSVFRAIYREDASTYPFKFVNCGFYGMGLPPEYMWNGTNYSFFTQTNPHPSTRPVLSYDYRSRDFGKLVKNSALINAGYDTLGTPAKDFYGIDSTGKRDIGACEYNGVKDLFYADTVHLFVDFDKADDAGDGRTIATAKKNVSAAYNLLPATADSTYVINLLPSTFNPGGRILTIDGSAKTFPSWTKSLILQSYYTAKDSFAVFRSTAPVSGYGGLVGFSNTVRHVHVKRIRFIASSGQTSENAITFEKFSAGQVFRRLKFSECVFDTANGGDWDAHFQGFGTAFFDSIDVYNCYFGGNSGSGNRALEQIYTDSSATYGVRLVNNTFHRLESVLFNCDNAGRQHFKLLNNIVSYSGVVLGPGGDTWSANTYANWNCYFNATAIAPSPVTQGTDTLVRDPKLQSFTWSNSGFGKLGDDSPAIAFGKDSVEFVDGKIHYVTPRFDLFAVKRTPRFDLGCLQFDATAIAGKRIFQQGLQGGSFGATEDAQIYGFDATAKTWNYGGRTNIAVRGGSPFKSVIRFPSFTGKASSLQVPSNAHVDSAFIYLYCTQGAGGDAEIYRITRDWTEGTVDGAVQAGSVTWSSAKHGTTAWGTEACDNLNDREPLSVSTNAAIGTAVWERWDITTLVQDWVSGVTNYGFLLSDQNSDMNLAAQFWSSEYNVDSTLRPKLVVFYDEDTVTVIHQAGTVTNTEVDDTYLSEASAANNYGVATGLRLQTGASARMFPLINFTRLKGSSGSNQIPANATVKSAELTLFRSDADAGLDVDESYAHRVTNIWEEGVQSGSSGSASWTGRYQSLNWASGGALGSTDHDPAAPSAGNSTGATIGQGIVWKADTAAVDWAGGAKNNGVLVKTTGTIATAIDFYSSEGTGSVSAFYNPKFKATYYGTGGNEGNTPWHTPTRPLLKLYTSVTGRSDTLRFRQGDTYGNTDDASLLYQDPTANFENNATYEFALYDSSDASWAKKGIIKFTNFIGSSAGQLPTGVVIDTAYIRLIEKGNVMTANIAVNVYRVNQAWNETEVSWNNRVTATAWSNAGTRTPTSATLIYSNVTLTSIDWYDTVFVPVTHMVQEWVNGGANNGVVIASTVTSAADAQFYLSEDGTSTRRPQLVVVYHKREQVEVQNVGRYATERSNFASADSLKNQFFMSFHTKTDSTDGMMNQWKTAATSPGQQIKGSYDLLPAEMKHFNMFNILRRPDGTSSWSYYADSVRSSATLSWSVIESTTTRMRYRVNQRTIYDAGSNPRNIGPATEITIYPTGQMFVWDSAKAADYQTTYNYSVYFATKDGTGSLADNDTSWGGLYGTAAGQSTLHDWMAAFLSNTSSGYTFPWTNPKLFDNINSLNSSGNYKGINFYAQYDSPWNSNINSYRQNFFIDFSTDDANSSDTLKRLYEDKRYPASMAGFRTGSKKTNASGDLDADGFNEKEGCYELTADNGEAYFWFNTSNPRPRYYPVFKLNGYAYNAAPSAVYLISPDETIIDTLEAAKGEVNISLLSGSIVVFQLNRHIDAGCIIYVGPRNTLAVEMGDFWGSADSGVCKLGWRTESEKDNMGFRLLRRIVRPGSSKRSAGNLESGSDFQVIKSYEWDERLRGQLTKALRTEYGVEDNTVKLGETYEYALESVDLSGNSKIDGRRVVLTVDRTFPFALGQNYPNPFNPSTTIRYQVPGRFSGKEHPIVRLRIFNVRGQLIRDLVSTRQRPDRYAILWNGKSNNGRYAASGVYFYRLEVGEGYRKVRKMIVVK